MHGRRALGTVVWVWTGIETSTVRDWRASEGEWLQQLSIASYIACTSALGVNELGTKDSNKRCQPIWGSFLISSTLGSRPSLALNVRSQFFISARTEARSFMVVVRWEAVTGRVLPDAARSRTHVQTRSRS